MSEVAWKSKQTQTYSWKKAHQKLRTATQANKGGHRNFVTKVRRRYSGMSCKMICSLCERIAKRGRTSANSHADDTSEENCCGGGRSRVQGLPSDERSSSNTTRAAESSGSRKYRNRARCACRRNRATARNQSNIHYWPNRV